tara:strand:+ start:2913 stop:3311 length:399 start_codon:yes stop_codon:yes gene_type:complete
LLLTARNPKPRSFLDEGHLTGTVTSSAGRQQDTTLNTSKNQLENKIRRRKIGPAHAAQQQALKRLKKKRSPCQPRLTCGEERGYQRAITVVPSVKEGVSIDVWSISMSGSNRLIQGRGVGFGKGASVRLSSF